MKLADQDQRDAFDGVLADRFPTLKIENTSAEGGLPVYALVLLKSEEQRIRDFALQQSLETIRNRIDQFGVTEPVIQRQGSEDILVQLPGIQDPERAKELIGRTAVLEFKLLSPQSADVQEYADGKKPPPPGTEVLNGPVYDPITRTTRHVAYLVEKKTLMRVT